MVWETKKIFNDDSILVNPTAVRVPVFLGHSEAISIETDSKMLREGINAHPVLARSLQSKQLRYRIRKMSCEK